MKILFFPVLVLAFGFQDRHPVPNPEDVKSAEKIVKDVFKDDYAKRSASDRSALAKKLLEQAAGSKDDPKSLYVLLREAGELAAQAGEPELALRAATLMTTAFDVEPVSTQSAALAATAPNVKTPDQLKALVLAQMSLAEEAYRRDVYEAAEKSASGAAAGARKLKDIPLTTKADVLVKTVAALKGRFAKTKSAMETLAKNPDDPAANHIVGQYNGVDQGAWDKAVPHLAKGAEGPLRKAAERDLANPLDPAEQAGVGDAWWDLAEKESGAAKENLRRRAEHWYVQALDKLSGLPRVKVEKRVSTLRIDRISGGSWVALSDPALFGLKGKAGDPIDLPAKKGTREEAFLTKVPAGTYDGLSLRIRYPKDGGGTGYFMINGKYRIWANHKEGGLAAAEYSSGFDYVGSLFSLKSPPRDEYDVAVFLQNGELVAYLNGDPAGRAKIPDAAILSLKLDALQGPVAFEQVRLRKKE